VTEGSTRRESEDSGKKRQLYSSCTAPSLLGSTTKRYTAHTPKAPIARPPKTLPTMIPARAPLLYPPLLRRGTVHVREGS
jgi:hypothetical protein